MEGGLLFDRDCHCGFWVTEHSSWPKVGDRVVVEVVEVVVVIMIMMIKS